MAIYIIKGSLRQAVDEVAFERLYKPNGWQIDTQEPLKDKEQEIITSLRNESEVHNYIKMTKKTSKQFNDKLFKGE